MAQRRKRALLGLPKYVTVVNKVYLIYRPRIPADKQHLVKVDKAGFLSPPVRLGKLGQPEALTLRKYLAAKTWLDDQHEAHKNTLFWVSEKYQESRQFSELAATTQQQYKGCSRALSHPIKKNGAEATLGELMASEISKPILQSVMERRLELQQAAGNKGQAAVNYEARYITSMLAWACNFVPDLGISQSPLKGLKRLKEPRNERYVTDREYRVQLAGSSGYLPAYFELAYLCAARKCEVRDLRQSDVLEEGLRIRRAKGSKHNIASWTPRLKAAVDLARKSSSTPKVVNLGDDLPLITDRKGSKITNEGIKSAMSRLKKKMKNSGLEGVFWSLHLLKHKGMTDAENKDLGGHKNAAIKDSYIHDLEVVKPAR